MSLYFEIDDVQPPEGARPIGGGFQPIFPEPTGLDGNGKPVGAVGAVRLILYFEVLGEDAWNWWIAQLAGALYKTFSSVSFYNPYKTGGAGWEKWSGGGKLHRPTFEDIDSGNYVGVQVVLTDVLRQ